MKALLRRYEGAKKARIYLVAKHSPDDVGVVAYQRVQQTAAVK
jgi:hypothetical protein